MRRKTLFAAVVAVLSLLSAVLPAAADLAPDGDPSAWVTNDRVFAIAQVGDRVYAGGRFTQVAPDKGAAFSDRAYLAAFDASSGAWISTFVPDLDGEVRALASSSDGSRLYVGGSFATVNGEARNAIVALDPETGATDTAFAAIANSSTVYDIEVDGDLVYLGGTFNNLNGVTNASRAARVNHATGVVDATWKPRPSARVEAISIPPAGDRVYLGGKFTDLAGVNADNMAAVRVDDATMIEDFEADSDSGCDSPGRQPGGIRAIDSTDDRVVALPYTNNCIFVFTPGQRNRVHQYDMDGDVQGVTLVGDRFYVGGHSAVVDGFSQNRLYAFNLDGTFDPSMTTDADGQPGIFAIFGSGPYLWLGGTIFTIGAENSIKDLGRVGPAPGEVIPSTPGGLAATTDASGATLTWSPSSDADGIDGYRIMRGNEQLAYVQGTTTYVDTRYREGEVSVYHVQAMDTRSNLSERSADLIVGLDGILVGPVADQLSGVGDSVDLTVGALGGSGPLTFSATGLPDGLSMAADGRITGTTTLAATYPVTVSATDGTDIGTDDFVWTVVNDSIPVGPDPLVEYSSPLDGQYLEGTDVSITGVASDDNGINRIRISLLNRTTSEYLQTDGTFAAGFARVDATLASPGATISAFDLSSTGLAPGDYRANALPISVDGGEGERVEVEFSLVTALGADPYGAVTFPEARTNVYGAFTIIGTATDDIGVAQVEVLIKEKFPTDAGRRLQDDFTWDAAYNTFPAQMTDPGDAVTQFWFEVPAGIAETNPYQIRVIVTDTDGNEVGETEINGFGIDGEYYAGRDAALPYPGPPNSGPGAQAPTVTITSPSASVLPANPVVIAGSATDNVSVDTVTVRLTNDIGWYLQSGGGFASGVADLPATVSGLGTVSASFSYDAGLLALGDYTVEVTATDSSALSTTETSDVTVGTGTPTGSDIVIGAGLIGNENNISIGSEADETRDLLLDTANFGPSGTVQVDSVAIVEDVANMTQGYLDGVDILFNGWVPQGDWSGGELDLVENWVNAGGVLVATNDSTTFDALATRFGNPIIAQGDGTWSSVAPGHPIVDGPFGSWATISGATTVFSYFGEVPGWTVIARNSANEPTIVTREVGDGYVIMTSDEGVFRNNIPGSNAVMAGNLFADAIDFVIGDATPTPTIDPIADQTNTVGDTVTLVVSASAPGGGIVFSEVGLPLGLSIDPVTGVISGSPTTVDVYDVTITATAGVAVSTSFQWTIETVPDTVEPDTMVIQPTTGEVVDTGTVSFIGTATDDSSGVAAVRVAVRDRDNLLWMQTDGTFAAPFALLDATLDAPGALSTGWTLDVDLPVAGRYAVSPRAIDVAGIDELNRPWITFEVADPITDFVQPDTAVLTPALNQVLPPGTVNVTGTATDDASGVAAVRVAIRDRDNLLWMQTDGTFAAPFALLDATLDAPDALSTGWSLDIDLPATGRYAVTPRAIDVAGNTETSRPWVSFEIS